MTAVAAERIFARESTLTGSIGVIVQTIDPSEMLARLGVRGEALVSGPLKDQPSPFHPLSPEGRAALQGVIGDMYDQFVGMVVAGRRLPEEKVRALADGRVFTGRQALAAGLVDAIGGEQEARAWLAAEKQGMAMGDWCVETLRERSQAILKGDQAPAHPPPARLADVADVLSARLSEAVERLVPPPGVPAREAWRLRMALRWR